MGIRTLFIALMSLGMVAFWGTVDFASNAQAQEIQRPRVFVDPLSDAQKRVLDAIVWDVDPEVLNAVIKKNEGGHFLYSDEKHPELFRESIENLGGVYVGVGTDQGYMFIGWQRPRLAFLVDYDPWVVMLHRIYFEVWKSCADSACLLQFFEDKPNAKRYFKSDAAKQAGIHASLAREIYKGASKYIARELKYARQMPEKNFMNDPETFEFIKKMILEGRIRTFQANLLGDRAFHAMSQALRELGENVTTLYLSNAEQYWNYSKQFKKNMLELPVASNAIVMRTSASKPQNGDYRYSIQPFSVFRAWLEHPSCANVWRHTQGVVVENPNHFPFTIDSKMPSNGGK